MATTQNSVLISGNNEHTYEIYDLGTGQSFNVSKYEGYKSFTINNFLISANVSSISTGGRSTMSGPGAFWGGGSADVLGSYNNSTGVATIQIRTNSHCSSETGGSWSDSKQGGVHAWLIIKK